MIERDIEMHTSEKMRFTFIKINLRKSASNVDFYKLTIKFQNEFKDLFKWNGNKSFKQ